MIWQHVVERLGERLSRREIGCRAPAEPHAGVFLGLPLSMAMSLAFLGLNSKCPRLNFQPTAVGLLFVVSQADKRRANSG